jgi:hypothetical protein
VATWVNYVVIDLSNNSIILCKILSQERAIVAKELPYFGALPEGSIEKEPSSTNFLDLRLQEVSPLSTDGGHLFLPLSPT